MGTHMISMTADVLGFMGYEGAPKKQQEKFGELLGRAEISFRQIKYNDPEAAARSLNIYSETVAHLLKHIFRSSRTNFFNGFFTKFLWFKTSHKNILRTVFNVIFCRS